VDHFDQWRLAVKAAKQQTIQQNTKQYTKNMGAGASVVQPNSLDVRKVGSEN
jgi:hypothetical protein